MQTARFGIAAAGLLLWVSCGTEDLPTDRRPSEPGPFLPGGDGGSQEDSGEGLCPESPPKIGESCGPDFTESTTCELVVGSCTAPGGAMYVDRIVFCCPGGFWETCGGRSPCDNLPEPDASTRDVGVDAAAAPDAAVDTLAAPDAALDLAVDTSPDLEPDAEVDASPDLAEPDAGVDAETDAAVATDV